MALGKVDTEIHFVLEMRDDSLLVKGVHSIFTFCLLPLKLAG